MDFNFDTAKSIFQPLFDRRPEVIPDRLKRDITEYYLPYVQKLIDRKNLHSDGQAIIAGVSAIQGTGKTTQGEILEILLKHFGYTSVSLSIDDHYLTHYQLCQLRFRDSRFIRRGVTHDISLAIDNLTSLQRMLPNQAILVAGYDKGANHGDGERYRWIEPIADLVMTAQVVEESLMVNKVDQIVKALRISTAVYKDQSLELIFNMGSALPLSDGPLPANLVEWLLQQGDQIINISSINDQQVKFLTSSEIIIDKKSLPHGWRVVHQKPDFIFYDGWMLGARKIDDESVFRQGLPALEKPEDQQFAIDVNNRLQDYIPLWDKLDFLTVLYVPNYKLSLQWRDQAEDSLRQKGQGMTHEQIQEFVYYFWRSVHPGIHIKHLAQNPINTHQVAIINEDHTVLEILSPAEVIQKYP